jgi:hypothetical protein
MSSNMNSFSPFPTSTTAPWAFGLFGQDPRDTHATYQDLVAIVRPSSHVHRPERTRGVSNSSRDGHSNAFYRGLRRFFGGL